MWSLFQIITGPKLGSQFFITMRLFLYRIFLFGGSTYRVVFWSKILKYGKVWESFKTAYHAVLKLL